MQKEALSELLDIIKKKKTGTKQAQADTVR